MGENGDRRIMGTEEEEEERIIHHHHIGGERWIDGRIDVIVTLSIDVVAVRIDLRRIAAVVVGLAVLQNCTKDGGWQTLTDVMAATVMIVVVVVPLMKTILGGVEVLLCRGVETDQTILGIGVGNMVVEGS